MITLAIVCLRHSSTQVEALSSSRTTHASLHNMLTRMSLLSDGTLVRNTPASNERASRLGNGADVHRCYDGFRVLPACEIDKLHFDASSAAKHIQLLFNSVGPPNVLLLSCALPHAEIAIEHADARQHVGSSRELDRRSAFLLVVLSCASCLRQERAAPDLRPARPP